MAAMVGRNVISRLNRSNTVLFVCDIQERFRPLIHNMPRVIRQTKLLFDATRVMNIPCIVTEQNPKALGRTVSELLQVDNNVYSAVFEKKQFSMWTPEVRNHLSSSLNVDLETPGDTKVLLCGLESHVCVLQTVMDLLESKVAVHIVCDAISSQRPYDRSCAINRAIAMGAVPTTTESAIFELMGTAEYENFKEISGMVKNHNDLVKTECPTDFE